MLDHADEQGIAFLPFFPIAVDEHAGEDGPLATVAKEAGATPAQVSLAWLLRRSPVVLPIPGTSSVAHLEENLGALDVRLTDDHVAALDKLGL
ncbi:aldo/keto reductase [Nonomuraea sp. NPDC050536]|uniref:aldo/keto reductase n=1 Tax=Nonomuraea sp. NPDC050536 TaxID=3364366 RepID=UPI0037C7D2E6